MDSQHSLVQVSRPIPEILQLTLNRPEVLNALNIKLINDLKTELLKASKDHDIKAILIVGNGRAFCAGVDINLLVNLNGQTGVVFAEMGQELFRLLENLGKPSLVAIQGAAMGGGCELAMSATLRIAADNAVFGQPEVRLGLIPGFGGTQRLSRLVGKGRALEICLTGRKVKAIEAQAIGLVSELVQAEQLNERAISILSNLIKLPAAALKSIMKSIDYGYNASLDEALTLEAAHFGLCCATQDKKEGVAAFLEKREASFIGE